MSLLRTSLAALIAVAALAIVLPQAHAGGPVRSGKIIASIGPTGPGECKFSPTCRAWRASGCAVRLAGRDPALFTSIVKVNDLAGSQRALYLKSPFAGWLATTIEFWSSRCDRLQRLSAYDAGYFRIPVAALWMTITTPAPDYSWQLW